eukprot:COSAG01_NODE_68364_length_264_cov_0.672727_2_plen_25_part_01
MNLTCHYPKARVLAGVKEVPVIFGS